jgi:hypothetical protein
MAPNEDELLVEIDGPDVAPSTVDPVGILSLAASYFSLLQNLADDQGIELQLTGIEVRDKCAALACRTSDRGAARELTGLVASYVSGAKALPKGYRGDVEQLRQAILRLPPHQKARVVVGPDWEMPLAVDADVDDAPPYETIHRRARPIRVGGKAPAVRFESGSEEHPFTLETSLDDAKAIAGYLYQDLDIVARVQRAPDNRISGCLIGFEPLADGDATEAWRSWYRHNAGADYPDSSFDQATGEHIERG